MAAKRKRAKKKNPTKKRRHHKRASAANPKRKRARRANPKRRHKRANPAARRTRRANPKRRHARANPVRSHRRRTARKNPSRKRRHRRNPGIPTWAMAAAAASLGLVTYAIGQAGSFALTQRTDPSRATLDRNRYIGFGVLTAIGLGVAAFASPMLGAGIAAGGLMGLGGTELSLALGRVVDKTEGPAAKLAGLYTDRQQFAAVYGGGGEQRFSAVYDGGGQHFGGIFGADGRQAGLALGSGGMGSTFAGGSQSFGNAYPDEQYFGG